jgi:LysR family glycine cleavage system transcriptional activator
MLHADDGREWHTWLAAADALDLKRGPQHHFGDARLGIEAAVQGYGVALGDTVTVDGFLASGQLVAPFTLVVPAGDSFYVACRSDLRSAPVVRVFIDWLTNQFEGDPRAESHPALRRTIRRGLGRMARIA